MVKRTRFEWVLVLVIGVGLVGGCAGPEVRDGDEAYDPGEQTNRAFFRLNDALDEAILAPVANFYVQVAPEPLRTAIFNFFDNLGYPNVFVNDFLQGKFEQGLDDVARFVVNSTFGIGGVIDFASGIGMERHEEDLGQTLAVWGFNEGAHLELPFYGPSNERDVFNIPASFLTDPLFYADVSLFPWSLIRVVDQRARLESAIRIRDESALDPYIYQREAYRQRRRHVIYDGNPPLEDLDLLGEATER